MKKPEPFSTDRPMVKDRIYLIHQGDVKKVCSTGSVIRMNLTGKWLIIKEMTK